MKPLLLLLLISLTATTANAQQAQSYTPVEGVNYHVLQTPVQTEGKIEVAEFFWYGCPHCFSMEPYLNNWLTAVPADVEFVRVPATFQNRENVMMHARTFYALQQMGVVEQHHDAIFEEMHVQKNKLSTQPEMERFLASRGVDVNALRSAMESFEVNMKIQEAIQLASEYGISGVPAMVVDKHYRDGKAGTWQQKFMNVNYLIEKARQNRAAAAAPAPVLPAQEAAAPATN
ncbi:MAG: thiol:disulfide interchange protein DsbA/DsbL [Gammaproteobacteria bacterium]|jgi:protein dithiol oxidoreductase (disulfide-forming)